MQPYFKIITLITVCFSIFLPFIYLRSFTLNSKAFKIFTFYLFFIGIIQLATQIAKAFALESNIFISHYYFIGQIIFLSFFYFEFLKKRIIWVVLIVFLLLLSIQYLNTQELYFKYNEPGLLFSHLIVIFYALIFLYRALSERLEFTNINIAILVYFLSSSISFASGNLIFDINISVEISQLLININVLLYLIFQIVIFVEWWKNYSIAKAR